MTDEPARPSAMNSQTVSVKLTESELDTIAWTFLESEFVELIYADWPIDRRVDAYLTHHGMTHVINNGDAYNAVLQHVLANIGPALRNGVLANTTWLTSRQRRSETLTPARASTLAPHR